MPRASDCIMFYWIRGTFMSHKIKISKYDISHFRNKLNFCCSKQFALIRISLNFTYILCKHIYIYIYNEKICHICMCVFACAHRGCVPRLPIGYRECFHCSRQDNDSSQTIRHVPVIRDPLENERGCKMTI